MTMEDPTLFEFWKEEVDLSENLRQQCNVDGEENTELSAGIFHKLGLIYKRKYEEFYWRLLFAKDVASLIDLFSPRVSTEIESVLPQILIDLRWSIIQSSILLNASLVRKPSNIEEVKRNLKDLQYFVLRLNGITYPFDISLYIERFIGESVKNMREETNGALKVLRHIPFDYPKESLHEVERGKTERVKLIVDYIAAKYAFIMRGISDACTTLMGKVPCRYAVVGVGEAGRNEMTTHSNFKHIILLEDEFFQNFDENGDQHEFALHYFQSFSHLFHVVVIRFGETVVSDASLPSLNDCENKENDWFYDDCTPAGISFDGMALRDSSSSHTKQGGSKCKLWKEDLIKPVSEMMELLDMDVELKNGLRLQDLLTSTRFVAGDRSVYDDFSNRVTDHLQKSEKLKHEDLLLILKDDLDNFDIGTYLDSLAVYTPFDLRRVVHRSTTLFITALGQFNSIYHTPCSCYEILDILADRKIIDKESIHALTYIVSIALEVRLKLCRNNGKRTVRDKQPPFYGPLHSILVEQIECVGERVLIDYYKMMWSLQNMINQNSYYMMATDTDNDIYMLYNLGLWGRALQEWRHEKRIHPFNKHRVLSALILSGAYDEAVELGRSLLNQSSSTSGKITSLANLTRALISASCKDEKIKTELKKYMETPPKGASRYDKWIVHESYAKYVFHLDNDYMKALGAFIKLQGMLQNTESLSKEFQEIAKMLYASNLAEIARCLHLSENNKQAAKKVCEASKAFSQLKACHLQDVQENNITLAVCYYSDDDYVKALEAFEKVLSLHKKHFCPLVERKIRGIEIAVDICSKKINGEITDDTKLPMCEIQVFVI